MGKFHHLEPEERKEIVENIVEKLHPRLEAIVKSIIGQVAITEPQMAEWVMGAVQKSVELELQKKLKTPWYYRLFTK